MTNYHVLSHPFTFYQLSTEDLSQCKLKTQTCFKNLQKVDRKSYLPNVDDPLAAFEEPENVQIVSIQKDGELSEPVSAEPGRTVIFHFDDNDFASHDEIIRGLVAKFQSEHGDMVIVYTGKAPSYQPTERHLIRRTRQAPSDDEIMKPAVLATDGKYFMLAYNSFIYQMGDKVEKVNLTDVALNTTTESTLSVKVSGGGHNLDFGFTLSAGSWELVTLEFDSNPLTVAERININQGFSYHCANLTAVSPKKENKIQIWLEESQFQPHWPAASTIEEFKTFGDSWDCTGFTSPPILAGLFVVLIFIIIASYGIAWMMDINTMDRFDDPKGKTITINVSE